MDASKAREIMVGAAFGIIGVVIGSVTTGLVNAHVQDKQQRSQVALESFKFDQGNYPVEYIQIKQLIDEMRNVSIASSSTIARLAKIQKKYPNCQQSLAEECRAAFVERIQALRDELGSDTARSDDIDIVIRGKYEIAQQAILKLAK